MSSRRTSLGNAITLAKIRSFEVPEGYRRVEKPGKTSDSLIYSWGVRLVGIDDEDDPEKNKWFCLASRECESKRRSLKCVETKNCTSHLKQVHKIVSQKEVSRKENVNERNSLLATFQKTDAYSNKDQSGFPRLILLVDTMSMIESLLPFNYFDTKLYRLKHALLGIPENSSKMIEKCLLEIYITWKDLMKIILRDQKVHLMADLWTHEMSHRKFIGIRVTFIDDDWVFHTHFLALREFRITSTIAKNKQWTRALGIKLKEILKEFDLVFENIITITTDAGSDFKKLLVECANYWFWCVSHLLHRVAVDTWKLTSMKSLVHDIREVYHFVSGRRDQYLLFMENKEDKDPLGLRLYQNQRWLGLADTLRRLIHHHHLLEAIFNESDNEYPFTGRLDLLKQYHTLFGHVSFVSTIAQDPTPDCGGVLKAIYMLLSKLENSSASTKSNELEYEEVRHARIKLSQGLQKRFFTRYDQPKDLVTEAVMFLNPSFKNYKAMEKALHIYWKNVPDVEAKIVNVKVAIEETIVSLYTKYFVDADNDECEELFPNEERVADDEESSVVSEDSWTEPQAKNAGSGGDIDDDTRNNIYFEISNYKSIEVPIVVDGKGKRVDYSCINVLDFWRKSDFTFLPLIVRQMAGSMPGSGPLENDFGLSDKCLNKWRSTLSSQHFGMIMTLNRNGEMMTSTDFVDAVEIIPWNRIGDFKELNEAVVVDEDDNTPPTEDDEQLFAAVEAMSI